MNLRSQKKVIESVAAMLVILGVGIVAWAFLFPVTTPSIAIKRQPPPKDNSDRFTELSALGPLLGTRLQGPLIAPEKKDIAADLKTAPPQPKWPKISLDCVFEGSESLLAVVKYNNQSYPCHEGQEFEQFRVRKIESDSIELEWRGMLRTFRIANGQGSGGTSQ